MNQEKITPTSVYVEWSESPRFTDKTTYPFDRFEWISEGIAQSIDYGYSKTNITVIFNNGAEYTCRLDINKECKRFMQHAKSLIRYYRKREAENNLDIYDKGYQENVEFLEKVTYKSIS